MDKIESKGKSNYVVGRQRATTPEFNLYECSVGDKEYFLKIAKTRKHNVVLDKEEFILRTLTDGALALESEYEKNVKSGIPLNNHFFFPELVDAYIDEKQEKRKVLILSLANICEKRSELAPMSFIIKNDRVCVDARTSAWILGKLLKMLVFTHGQGVLINAIHSSNIILNKAQHFVSILNWSKATISNVPLTPSECRGEIVQITKQVIILLGGDLKTGLIPADEDQMPDTQYQDFLKLLLNGSYDSAYDAHHDFYKLIRALWPTGFHHYATKPLIK